MTTIARGRVAELAERERQRFVAERPRSQELHERARRSQLGGVPMNWMVKWAGAFPVFVAEAHGAHVIDVDGHEYVDLCLGDTGAMLGHSPAPVTAAIADQASRGVTTMLPSEDGIACAEELAARFGLPFWQFTTSATDANRFVIRIARHLTGRPRILVFNWCYHGSVDETFVTLDRGLLRARDGNLGPPVDLSTTTRVVEFNDASALEQALAPGDVACLLMEPALTNIGIVLPEPGFHDAVRTLCREAGTLLVMDETHCLCAGPGGYTREHGLEPDLLTLGKTIGGGIPTGAYGMTATVAEQVATRIDIADCDTGGIGGTLAGNALSLAAMRATLGEVLTPAAYERMLPLAERFAAGVDEAITAHSAPWHVERLGCRAEYQFAATRPRNGGEAAAAIDADLDGLLHLYALNRGVLMTPFHNMALMSPATTAADVDRHTAAFGEALAELTAAPVRSG